MTVTQKSTDGLTFMKDGEVILEAKMDMSHDDCFDCAIAYHEMKDGLFRINATWTNRTAHNLEEIFRFVAAAQYKPSFYLIPCVSYHGNGWGNGLDPKGLRYQGQPWVFPYDRTGIPSANFSEGDKYAVGMFVCANDPISLHSACSMEETENTMIHTLYWPEQEAPVSYAQKEKYGNKVERFITVKAGESFSVVFYIHVTKVTVKNYTWASVLPQIYQLFNQKKPLRLTKEEIWYRGMEYAKILKNNRCGKDVFEIGLLPNGDHDRRGRYGDSWAFRDSGRYEIGWCGQHGLLALAYLQEYCNSKKETYLNQAIAVLDTWKDMAVKSNGLFDTHLSDDLSHKETGVCDTCNLGWGAWIFMLAANRITKAGVERPDWQKIGLRLCDFFVENYSEKYFFGKLWNVDGSVQDKDGTIGAFLLLPMVEAFRQTQNQTYLACAEKAFCAYATRDLDGCACTAGALDTQCIDKETCWPLLKTAIDLWEITKLPYYKDEAIKAAQYIASWMYFYNVDFKSETDMMMYGFETFGLTSVSTQHHHLDVYACLMYPDFERLSLMTKEDIWHNIGTALWNASLQGVSDGNTVIHDMIRPIGAQNEAYFQCNWSWKDDVKKGDINDWLVAWPTAFRLFGIIREEEDGFK